MEQGKILTKNYFVVGNTYKKRQLQEMAESDKVEIHILSTSISRGFARIKRTAALIELKDGNVLWFVFVGYENGERIYKCVMHEN
jgi:TolB-like protein